jgi:hypothetical protein
MPNKNKHQNPTIAEKIVGVTNKADYGDDLLDNEQAWEIYKHIDSIREGRANFFLVAESMMIAAFVALHNSANRLRYAVIVLAVIYSLSWFFVNLRQSNRLNFLAQNFLSRAALFVPVMKAGKGVPGRVIMSVLPVATTLFWVLLFFICLGWI